MKNQELSSVYIPREVEQKWYSFWLEKGYFRPALSASKNHYCIVIPPPNVTGSLHIGHALNNTLQDILVRYRRMRGDRTLWVFGTDHAGIATQNVVERELAKEGLSREELGREKFVRQVWQWKASSGATITNQLKLLGSSCDWNRERFTMDDGLSRAVRRAFIQLYREGLIYRGNYIINWCPRCHTALSDLEVEHEELQGHLYHIKYPLIEVDGYLTVATTRPETMLGDTAVAVHPEDERYQTLIGRKVWLPVAEREIPIIADSFVDPKFGSGAVKVTPAHDPYDFEVGQRHGLPHVVVIAQDGSMTGEAGKYAGQDRFACRRNLLQELQERGFLERIEPYWHAVGHCYRCKTIIEPLVSLQWFLRTKELARPAIEAVRDGRIKLIPKFWENTYFDWMEKIRDWCISRQIWWGHRIPIWYCESCKAEIPAGDQPPACPYCQSTNLRPEQDVLDTWFSSALWPFSTLGWPDWEEPKLREFYPTSTLVTSFDILFFWVARMIMMGLKFMGDVPFREVYLHALVRDEYGKKMSKSKGNIVDPLGVMDVYGTDAFRFTLTALTAQGRDIRLSEQRIQGYRNFMNKIWNAGRLVLANLDGYQELPNEELELNLADKWILIRLEEVISKSGRVLENYNFSALALGLYSFFWHEFCDWYLELVKRRFTLGTDPKQRLTAQNIAVLVLETSLRLLHPIVPFITEEMWQRLPRQSELPAKESIMQTPWPDAALLPWAASRDELAKDAVKREMSLLQEIISQIRTVRAELQIPPSKKLAVWLKPDHGYYPPHEAASILQYHAPYIEILAGTSELVISPDIARPTGSAAVVAAGVELYVALEGVDVVAEKTRLEQKLSKLFKERQRVADKLSSENFLTKAPAEVVEEHKTRQEGLSRQLDKLSGFLQSLE